MKSGFAAVTDNICDTGIFISLFKFVGLCHIHFRWTSERLS